MTETTVTDEGFDNAIGVATAPTPTGPWTDSGAPLVGPRRGESGDPGDFLWTFDPSELTTLGGTRYLYYGSYYGGVFVTRLSRDGLRTMGEPTMVGIDNRFEGAYVVRRGAHYYMFASSADCCAGPTTGYSVFVGRSKSPRGPFLDREGRSMSESRAGGTIVISPNGNRWVGTGHNSVVTDMAGQDWLAYHAIDRHDPYLDPPELDGVNLVGVNERPMLFDRLDWNDGWPIVRGGKWASARKVRAPVGRFAIGGGFGSDDGLGANWRSTGVDWNLRTSRQNGAYVSTAKDSCNRPTYLVSRAEWTGDRRAEADLRLRDNGRGAVGLVVAYESSRRNIVAWLDARDRALVTEVVRRNGSGVDVKDLPGNFRFDEWHTVAVELRGNRIHTEVTDARLHDPIASGAFRVPRNTASGGSVGVVAARCGRVDADNVGEARLYRPHAATESLPRTGSRLGAFRDEFNDDDLDGAWSWVRPAQGEESGGAFTWPTQDADLFKDDNSASVLLRDAPGDNYTVETELGIDLGVDTDRSFQQAGLIVYAGDNRYAKLVHVAVFNTRQTEYAKEMPFAGGIAYGGMIVGPPDDHMWLRIVHRRDRKHDEHEYRALTSRDGEHWIRGGVWTMSGRVTPRIGLVSMGGPPSSTTSG